MQTSVVSQPPDMFFSAAQRLDSEAVSEWVRERGKREREELPLFQSQGFSHLSLANQRNLVDEQKAEKACAAAHAEHLSTCERWWQSVVPSSTGLSLWMNWSWSLRATEIYLWRFLSVASVTEKCYPILSFAVYFAGRRYSSARRLCKVSLAGLSLTSSCGHWKVTHSKLSMCECVYLCIYIYICFVCMCVCVYPCQSTRSSLVC